ncbi:MAG: cytochrome-c oxidase [Gammaproteobacteria bacterium]|nr:cytochrome-c oxidase [Gammaproteobacteria bacterium]
MGFFRKILEKPWLPPEGNVVEFQTSYFSATNRKVALVLFLCVVGILFFLLFSAYHMRKAYSTDWVATPEPTLIWFNTLVLFIVSGAFEWTRAALAKEQIDAVRMRFYAAGWLTVLFLVLQLVAWKQLIDMGYIAQSNPANAFFYTITGIHGLHLVGGLIAWYRALRYIKMDESFTRMKNAIDQCALYWHFLLFVWVAMIGLFITS